MKALRPKNLLIALAIIATAGALIFALKPINEVEIAPPTEEVGSQAASLTESIATSEIPAKKSADQIKLSAASAYLMNSEKPLYTFRSQKQWPAASLTKLMTALTTKKLMPETEIITMDEKAVAAFGEAGDFKAGERFTAEDLMQAMLVSSSNDAAEALANHYGGEAFIATMNELATDIGMTNTVFLDATGLSPANLSTPEDLSKLTRFIWLEDPEIFATTRLKTVTIIDIDSQKSRKLTNINFFAGRPDFLGGKTGQLPDSDGNLISIFSLPDKSSPVVIVVLGAEDRFGETERILVKL